MIFFEIALIGMACIVLILMFMVWDTLRTGLHVPYDDAQINWPIDHPMYKPQARAWVKRMRDEA